MNKLLKNPLDTNVLEIGCSNVILKVNKNTTISITGAKCEFFINDELKPIWQNYSLKKGDILKIGKIISGNWIYLAVKDGFNLTKELGSFSTTIKENIGGLDGNRLKIGDVLSFNKSKKLNKTFLKKELIPKYEDELILRVVLSSQHKDFSKKELEKFFLNSYMVTNDFNRMAYKLQGDPIRCNIDGIVSEGISFGSIQIPKDGKPIILLKERQTIGGYPKLGFVLAVDCFKLAQARTNTKIKFQEISYEEALEKTKEFYASFV